MAYGTQRFNAEFTKGSPIIPILSQINQISRIDTYFFKINSNIVLPSTSRSKGLFPVGLRVNNLKALLPSSILVIRPAHHNLPI